MWLFLGFLCLTVIRNHKRNLVMRQVQVITKDRETSLDNAETIRNIFAYTGFHLENTAEILGVSSFELQAAMIKYDIYFIEF